MDEFSSPFWWCWKWISYNFKKLINSKGTIGTKIKIGKFVKGY